MSTYERITYLLSGLLCRFGYHTLACRGRTDHAPHNGKWTSKW